MVAVVVVAAVDIHQECSAHKQVQQMGHLLLLPELPLLLFLRLYLVEVLAAGRLAELCESLLPSTMHSVSFPAGQDIQPPDHHRDQGTAQVPVAHRTMLGIRETTGYSGNNGRHRLFVHMIVGVLKGLLAGRQGLRLIGGPENRSWDD